MRHTMSPSPHPSGRTHMYCMHFTHTHAHTHTHTPTHTHTRICTHTLNDSGLVNALGFAVIYFKFAIEVGGCYDVNYISFCKMVDDFALTTLHSSRTQPSLHLSLHTAEVLLIQMCHVSCRPVAQSCVHVISSLYMHSHVI